MKKKKVSIQNNISSVSKHQKTAFLVDLVRKYNLNQAVTYRVTKSQCHFLPTKYQNEKLQIILDDAWKKVLKQMLAYREDEMNDDYSNRDFMYYVNAGQWYSNN